MFKTKKKYMLLLAVALLVTFSLSTVAAGAPAQKIIRIFSNGQQVTGDKQPMLVNGTTYVPLRMLGNIFNKNVAWDNNAYAVLLTDKPDSSAQKYQEQIKQLEATVSQLKAQLADRDGQIIVLKAQIAAMQAKEEEVTDIDDLEDQLNEDYGEYEDIEFDITLSGDEDDVTVKIEVDLDDYQDEWDALDSDDIESYLQDIVDDILSEYEDADIEGYIEDVAGDEELVSFTVDSRGNVDMEFAAADLDDLENELEDYYLDYFEDDYGFEFDSIVLEGDKDEITFTVYLDYDYYESEWGDVSDSEIDDFMAEIYDDIADEYEDADIYGYIIDSNDEDNELYEY
jgi:TolA-binding protein